MRATEDASEPTIESSDHLPLNEWSVSTLVFHLSIPVPISHRPATDIASLAHARKLRGCASGLIAWSIGGQAVNVRSLDDTK